MTDSPRPRRMSQGRLLGAALLIPPFALALGGCVRPLELPDLGECAVYPEGLYDYGDMGIGTCLSGPVDLKVLPDATASGGYRLYVSNTNPNLLFTSGSILALDSDRLEDAAAAGGVSLIHDLTDPADAYITRSYSGPLELDPDRGVFYYGNRLSFTTANTAEDRIEAVRIGDDGRLSLFDGFDDETGDGTYALAGHDPYALARHPSTGQLYSLNITSHDITIFDTSEQRSDSVRYARIYQPAQLPEPLLADAGLPSMMETLILEADEENLPVDRFELIWNDVVRRMFYAVDDDGRPAIAFADSGDGFHWQPNGAGAVLRPSDSPTSWDRGGVLDVTVLENSGNYIGWYTATDGAVTRIGYASTPGDWPAGWSKYDAGVEDDPSDDAVLDAGPDSFDIAGVSRPAIYRADTSVFRMWYNALGDDGITRIAAARADNVVEWTKQGVALESEVAGHSVADAQVQLRSGGGFVMYYVEGDLTSSACVRYAESEAGDLAFVGGGLDGRQAGCIVSEAQGLPPLLRRPQLVVDAFQSNLFVVGADSAAGPWTQYHLRSFDAETWELLGDASLLPAADGQPELQADLQSFSLLPASETAGGYRVEQENVGILSVNTTLGSSFGQQGLEFAVLSGHAVAVPAFDAAWWGAPNGREIYEGVRLESPAVLPSLERLYLTARLVDEPSRIGFALPQSGEFLPQGSMWTLPARDAGAITGLASADSAGVEAPALLQPTADPDVLWLYYAEVSSDEVWRLRRAVSADGGQSWSQATTVLTGEDGLQIGDPSALVGHDGRFHLFYASQLGGGQEIVHATSADGVSFTAQTTGGLQAGEPGGWDDAGVSQPTVLWDTTAGVYRMWYTGNDGARLKIGYAEGEPDADGLTWTRYRSPVSSQRVPVFTPSVLGWDAGGVSNPVVIQDSDGRFRMWFQGDFASDISRVGAAISNDGIVWNPFAVAPTAGDTVRFTTAASRTSDTDAPKDDATVSLELTTSPLDGTSATEFELVPVVHGGETLYCFAVITTRRTPRVYLMDVYDDSAAANGGRPGPCVEATNPALFASADENFVDANYNELEEVFLIENNLEVTGARAVTFSADGRRMYMTSQFPDSLQVIDTAHFVDDENLQVGDIPLPVIGVIEMARGGASANSDADNQTGIDDYSADIGPTSVVISPLAGGRYAFVANANDHTIYTIDLQLGAYGQVIHIASVGDVPFDIELSPDNKLLFVGNYAGEVDGSVVNATLSIVSADPESDTFGSLLATLKNREI